MRPQDVVILLKKTTKSGRNLLNKDIASSLKISASEVSEALERCRIAKLVDRNKQKVNIMALEEFLIYGLKYVFPVQPDSVVRGVSTAFSASPIKEEISQGKEKYVWPYNKGTERGQGIEPLYKSVPEIVNSDTELYELLVIVDTLRIGKIREIEIATAELKKRFQEYGR
ncbi:hypothetical protein DWY55_17015 [Bacteroides sp. AF25-38AC]|nr:hypothetical protein DWY55_17015 [Bacteroides sp. AF25-38AC]